jgi:gamma-glutamylputrescine oxidase
VVAGNSSALDLLTDLQVPPFPGGQRLRGPLLFLALTWFALRDRF